MTVDFSHVADDVKVILRDAARLADDAGLVGTAKFLRASEKKVVAWKTLEKVRETLNAMHADILHLRLRARRFGDMLEGDPRFRLKATVQLLNDVETSLERLGVAMQPAPRAEERTS